MGVMRFLSGGAGHCVALIRRTDLIGRPRTRRAAPARCRPGTARVTAEGTIAPAAAGARTWGRVAAMLTTPMSFPKDFARRQHLGDQRRCRRPGRRRSRDPQASDEHEPAGFGRAMNQRHSSGRRAPGDEHEDLAATEPVRKRAGKRPSRERSRRGEAGRPPADSRRLVAEPDPVLQDVELVVDHMK